MAVKAPSSVSFKLIIEIKKGKGGGKEEEKTKK
jgi:hypothetical protein